MPAIIVSATACGSVATPSGRVTEPPASNVMTVPDIEAEMDRLAELNQNRDISALVWPYEPTPLGIDARNGQVLGVKYICWDICPDIGAYYLVYLEMTAEYECQALSGRPLFAPTPVPGPYIGCRVVAE